MSDFVPDKWRIDRMSVNDEFTVHINICKRRLSLRKTKCALKHKMCLFLTLVTDCYLKELNTNSLVWSEMSATIQKLDLMWFVLSVWFTVCRVSQPTGGANRATLFWNEVLDQFIFLVQTSVCFQWCDDDLASCWLSVALSWSMAELVCFIRELKLESFIYRCFFSCYLF